MTDHTYERTRRVTYGDANFVPVCAGKDGDGGCGRFVKADPEVTFTGGGDGPPVHQPNATCARCGRVMMLFEGYVLPCLTRHREGCSRGRGRGCVPYAVAVQAVVPRRPIDFTTRP